MLSYDNTVDVNSVTSATSVGAGSREMKSSIFLTESIRGSPNPCALPTSGLGFDLGGLRASVCDLDFPLSFIAHPSRFLASFAYEGRSDCYGLLSIKTACYEPAKA